jgi:hypothetical protein
MWLKGLKQPITAAACSMAGVTPWSKLACKAKQPSHSLTIPYVVKLLGEGKMDGIANKTPLACIGWAKNTVHTQKLTNKTAKARVRPQQTAITFVWFRQEVPCLVIVPIGPAQSNHQS